MYFWKNLFNTLYIELLILRLYCLRQVNNIISSRYFSFFRERLLIYNATIWFEEYDSNLGLVLFSLVHLMLNLIFMHLSYEVKVLTFCKVTYFASYRWKVWQLEHHNNIWLVNKRFFDARRVSTKTQYLAKLVSSWVVAFYGSINIKWMKNNFVKSVICN